MADQTEMKDWKCAGGSHVLGKVKRNGSGVRELLLYRQAVDPNAEAPAEVDLIAVVIGQVIDVRCSECGKVRTWVPGEEALRQLLERMGK